MQPRILQQAKPVSRQRNVLAGAPRAFGLPLQLVPYSVIKAWPYSWQFMSGCPVCLFYLGHFSAWFLTDAYFYRLFFNSSFLEVKKLHKENLTVSIYKATSQMIGLFFYYLSVTIFPCFTFWLLVLIRKLELNSSHLSRTWLLLLWLWTEDKITDALSQI